MMAKVEPNLLCKHHISHIQANMIYHSIVSTSSIVSFINAIRMPADFFIYY